MLCLLVPNGLWTICSQVGGEMTEGQSAEGDTPIVHDRAEDANRNRDC